MENEIQIYNTPELKALDESKAEQIKAIFDPMYIMLKGFETEYHLIVNEVTTNGVTKETTVKAKRLRLDIAKVRNKADKARKEAKEEYLRAGRAIDGVNNILKHAVISKEEKLKEIEEHFETQEKIRIADLQNARVVDIFPYLDGSGYLDYAAMDEEVWEAYFNKKKKDHNDRLEAERKAVINRIETERREQAERERKEQEASKERERLRKEHEEIKLANEKLKQEAAEKERIIAKGIYAAKKKEQEFVQKEMEIKRIALENEQLNKEREVATAKAIEAKREQEKAKTEELERREKESLDNIEKTLRQEELCLENFISFIMNDEGEEARDFCDSIEGYMPGYLEEREKELREFDADSMKSSNITEAMLIEVRDMK